MRPEWTPNLYRLATEHGTIGRMKSTFTTKTFPNHHSISTGLYQESHGIINNVMYDPLIKNEIFSHRKAEQQSNDWWDYQHYHHHHHHQHHNHHKNCNKRSFPITPIYIANQLYGSNRFSCCSPWIGCFAHYRNQTERARYYRPYNQSADWYEQFNWTMKHMFTNGTQMEANLALIYISEPDSTAHDNGPFGSDTMEMLKKIDIFIEYIHRCLMETFTNINLIMLSDHGLIEISPRRVIVLETFLNDSTYLAYGTNPVIHIDPIDGFERTVESALNNNLVRSLPMKIYSKDSIPNRYRYRDNRRIRSFLLVANPGWSIYSTRNEAQSMMGKRGEHGYDNQIDSMRPLFVGIGPSFKRSYFHRTSFVNVDLYPLMLHLLDIPIDQYYHQGRFHLVSGMLNEE
ncbi:hypothetical protein RDWZM_004802 [Blomia tropicalis]|uniref:Uncharacterized protein n=1 Tax=Blomia tropicalis TaxID=40697 RepID=A0A9Q0M7Q5_BLOTA|nr:hypothetical protein RDWZM_004802 [Blomia tropicalis]